MVSGINGRNALITGSSRGIGLAIAKELGKRGANVTLNCDKSADELSRAVSELEQMGVNVVGIMGDASVYSECERIVGKSGEFGDIDILVNNAGISEYGLFTDMQPGEWQRLTEINQFSVYNCCRLVLPQMISKKNGHIINISSIWGVCGASCEVAYSATKGAVNAFTKALAKEVAPSGVFVNAIACGFVDTKMNGRFTEEEREQIRLSVALMKLGKPEDIAKLCVYLAETEYMTGQVLVLDGGSI